MACYRDKKKYIEFINLSDTLKQQKHAFQLAVHILFESVLDSAHAPDLRVHLLEIQSQSRCL
jgi:hypothetical protein